MPYIIQKQLKKYFLKNTLEIERGRWQLERYPTTTDGSLRAWSNAELLVLDYIGDVSKKKIHLFNDRFGVWNCALEDANLVTIYTYASQKKAVLNNLQLNNLSTNVVFKNPLDSIGDVDLALLKVPKSLELFELFLKQIYDSSNESTEVVCGFMLKYFSPSLLKVANLYFEDVSQTKAWKKARLLILKKPKKEIISKDLLNTVLWKGRLLKQYYGVFSSGKVDIGTQFFLEHLKIGVDETKVLDLASGNGIIAYEVTQLNKEAKVTLVDDFSLAIDSSRLNLEGEKADFICADNIESLKGVGFDLVVSNPPFHFEHENNIEVTLSLFKGVKDCLKPNGRFVLVANTHLNYKTHLVKLFKTVNLTNANNKFVIYECYK